MTAGQSTRRMSSVSLAQAAIAGLVGATLLAGGLIGAAMTSQIGSADESRMTISAAGLPPVMFDAVQFRAEERGVLPVSPISGHGLAR